MISRYLCFAHIGEAPCPGRADVLRSKSACLPVDVLEGCTTVDQVFRHQHLILHVAGEDSVRRSLIPRPGLTLVAEDQRSAISVSSSVSFSLAREARGVPSESPGYARMWPPRSPIPLRRSMRPSSRQSRGHDRPEASPAIRPWGSRSALAGCHSEFNVHSSKLNLRYRATACANFEFSRL
jgi:hypothetical protein